jgi:hypothetical protein
MSGATSERSNRMSGTQCELIAMKLQEEEKENPGRRKVLERTIVAAAPRMQRYHWGTVQVSPGKRQGAIYLAKDRFRVRVEGWVGDIVELENGWEFCDPDDCNGQIVIVVWSSRHPDETIWGPPPMESGHEHTYWIEYVGPRTGTVPRRAGPFGCTGDPVDHAMSDAGFSRPGLDGGYTILDSEDNVVELNA